MFSLPLDAENTSLRFAVRWLGVTTVRGGFTDIAGNLTIPNGCVEEAEIAIDVAAASVTTGIALRDRHLRGREFLDAARHPLISFRSSAVERTNGTLMVHGTIDLRGTRRSVAAACPIDYARAEGDAVPSHVLMTTRIAVPRLEHGVGEAIGIHRLNPLLYAIGTTVSVDVSILVPAMRLLPALLPALGR